MFRFSRQLASVCRGQRMRRLGVEGIQIQAHGRAYARTLRFLVTSNVGYTVPGLRGHRCSNYFQPRDLGREGGAGHPQTCPSCALLPDVHAVAPGCSQLGAWMGPGREHTLEEGTVPLKTSLGVHLHYSLSKTTSVSAGAGGGYSQGWGVCMTT